MYDKNISPRNLILAIGTFVGWLAVILQFYLIILNRTAPVAETIIRFFSFFTVLTNILVAICFTVLLIQPNSVQGSFLSRPRTLTAVAVYITVVGLIYNIILRFLWSPEGLQLIVDELLHSVIPLWFILCWLIYVPKDDLSWKNMFPWMLYPSIYCIYILIRGKISEFYPYPFIDAGKLGYNKVLINIVGLIMVFLLVSCLFIGIAKLSKRRGN